METSSTWLWDPARHLYYRHSREEQCIIYQDGTRIPIASSSTGGERLRSDSGVSNQVINTQDDLVSGFSRMQVGSGHTYSAAPRSYNASSQGYMSAPAQYGMASEQPRPQYNQYNILRDQSGATTTDPKLLSSTKVRAFVRVGATPGEKEVLDKRYQIQKHPRQFFKRGRVFRIVWPEPAGQGDQVSVYSQGAYNEDYHMKVRWFVVIREGSSFCSCLPINTYNGQGVEKRICVKDEHSIIYTGSEPPKPTHGEKPKRGENPMHEAIQVKGKRMFDRLDSMSRVNYAKVYTVEHNVKVFEFGDVTRKSRNQLVRNFKAVWRIDEEHTEEDIPEEDDEEDEESGYAVYAGGVQGVDEGDDDDDDDDDDNDDVRDSSIEQTGEFSRLIAALVQKYRAANLHPLADWLLAAPVEAQLAHIRDGQQQRRQETKQAQGSKRRH